MKMEQRFVRALHALRRHRSHAPDRPLHEVYQASTVNALLEGVLDGEMTYGELGRHGDFGIGTFNALDGEMVAFDGAFWQIRSDGSVSPVSHTQRLPFATVLFFEPVFEQMIEGPIDLLSLEARIDGVVKSPNLFYAVRIDGRFDRVRARSVPRQSKPYPPLDRVAETQPVFDIRDVGGTLAGFRFPDFAEGLNVPGYHLHFLTDDRTAGGHVLSVELAHGHLAVDNTSNIHIELPTDEAFLAARIGGDHSAELRKAEK